MPDLFTFGEALALFLSTDTDNVVDAREYKRSTAGAEGNVSVALSRLGLKSTFFTRLGNDELGSAILNDFIAEGVDISLVKRVPEFTSAMVRNPGTTRGVEATYLRTGSAASTMVASDINIDAMRSARWIHSTGITCAISKTGAETVAFALEESRKLKIRRSFDLNIRRKLWSEVVTREVLEPLARELDLLIGGEDEYAVVFGQSDPKKALQTATERGCRIAVMTKGSQPIRFIADGTYGEVIPPKVVAVDPVGSGDAFTGGVIAGLLAGLSAHDAIVQGSRGGALVASSFGDWAGLPYGKLGIINSENGGN